MWIFRDRSTRYYEKLELKGTYREIGVQVIARSDLAPHKNFRFDFFYEQIERILAQKMISRVIVHRWENFHAPAFGGLEEIRAALQRLTDAGKEVYYYAPEYDSGDCFLASACSHRILHPLGKVSFLGKAMSSVFFKKLLDKYSVDVTVIRRERYKSAADSFRGEKYDEYAREQYQELLDGLMKSMRQALVSSSVSKGKAGFSEEILDEMLSGRIYNAPDALEAGMVDDLCTVDDLTNKWNTEKVKKRSPGMVLGRFGSGAKVAVLVFEGMIAEGGNRRSPVFGQALGDRPMVQLIRKLRKSKKTRAVIFRINSNGGSAVASENILRELVALHKTKPLVISMGPVAGSGGYWISTTGRRLFALPTTITGSIGVISILFNLSDFLRQQGLTTDFIKHGESADIGSALRPLTDKEKEMIEENIDFLYKKFLDLVAGFRNLSAGKIHELGEGRLWLGKEAVDRGLVDEPGGLYDAIAHTKGILKAKNVRVRFYPRQPYIFRLIARRNASNNEKSESRAGIFQMTNGSGGLERALATLLTSPLSDATEPGHGILNEIADTCLSVHGRPLFVDPSLFQFLSCERDPGICK